MKGLFSFLGCAYGRYLKIVGVVLLVLVCFMATVFAVYYSKDPQVHVVLRSEGGYYLVDTLRTCSYEGDIRYAHASESKDYVPTNHDKCIRCNKPYWRHWHKQSDKEKQYMEDMIYQFAVDP